NVLQIAAIEEDAVVAGAGDEAEGIRVALAQRHAEVQILDEDPLAVVAELRNDDERYVRAMHHGIGPDPGTQCDAEIPVPDRDAIAARSGAVVCRRGARRAGAEQGHYQQADPP